MFSRFARWPLRRSPSQFIVAVFLVAALTTGAPARGTGATGAAAASSTAPKLFYSGKPDAAAFRALCEGELQSARKSLDRMLAVKDKRTIANTLDPYNLVMLHSDNAGSYSSLMESVHPDSAFRASAETLTQEASKFQEELKLNRAVYDALKAVDVSKADPTTKYFVSKTLRDFRLSGVDQDEASRKRIAAMREDLLLVSQDFDRNIRNDSRKIQVTAADLDGLPADFLKTHTPGADGKITLSIEYPDYFPVMRYCKSSETRRRIQFSANRAYPANMAVSTYDRERDRLAHVLGYANWADYITADKMIGDGSTRPSSSTESGI